MCESHAPNYNFFPSLTIGGPPGLYKVRCPVPSKELAEYNVVSIANFLTNPATVLVSGTDQPPAIDTTGASTFDDTTFQRCQAYSLAVSSSITPNEQWDIITSPEGYVFVRIVGGVCTFVTIKFREKILRAIPAPARTVNPNEPEQYHQLRAKKVQNMVLGKEGELEEYGSRPGQLAGIRRY